MGGDGQTRARLLLVDDDEGLRRAVARWLEARLPVRVIAAADAEEALELLRSGERFDGAIVDWEMPGATGVELVDQFAAIAPSMPCGIWSASDQLFTIDAPLASFVLAKGDPRQLAHAVKWMLGQNLGSDRQPRSSEVRRRFDPGHHGGENGGNGTTD